MGSPIKGLVKRKNTSPCKKMSHFSLDPFYVRSSAPARTGCSHPLFLCFGYADKSAPVTHPDQGDCDSSLAAFNHGPWLYCNAPEIHRFHTVSNGIFTNLMVISQPVAGSRHRRIKLSKKVPKLNWIPAAPNQT